MSQSKTARRASGRPSRRRIAFGEPDVTGRIHFMSVRRQSHPLTESESSSRQTNGAMVNNVSPTGNGAMICRGCLDKDEYLGVLQNRLEELEKMANNLQRIVVEGPLTEEPLSQELGFGTDRFSRMDSVDFLTLSEQLRINLLANQQNVAAADGGGSGPMRSVSL